MSHNDCTKQQLPTKFREKTAYSQAYFMLYIQQILGHFSKQQSIKIITQNDNNDSLIYKGINSQPC